MQKKITLAAAAALALGNPAWAQDETGGAAGTTLLDTLVVSAGREPVDSRSLGRAVTIVTAEEIEDRQVTTVAEALRQVPGLAVSQSGGAGGSTVIRVRGAEANHVLVMIDGIETASPSGGFDFSDLVVDEIERIEVLRGPQSSLWGSNATAGVINIITKSGMRNGHAVRSFVEGGSNGSYAVGAGVQGGNDSADISLSAIYRNEQGWDAAGKGGEKDGNRNFSVRAKANVDVTENLTLRINGRFADRRGEFDDTGAIFPCSDPSCYVSDANNFTTGQDIIFGLSADYRMLGGQLVYTPSFSYASRTNKTTSSWGQNFNDVSTLKAGQQVSYSFGATGQHELIGAVDFKQETFSNSYAGGDTKRRNQVGAVVEFRSQITDRLFVQLSARHDWNEDFGDATTWSASTSYAIHESGTRLHASAGKGVTNPTFFELYGYVPGQFVGNSSLVPEENTGFDFGVEQTFLDGMFVADATYFNETLANEIKGSGTSVSNLAGKSHRQGVELSLAYNPIDAVTLKASYTYLDATEPDGSVEIRRPKHSAGLNAEYRFMDGRAKLGTDVTISAGLYDEDWTDPAAGFPTYTAPKVKLADYVKVDLYGSYEVNEHAEFYGRIVNLFDADYQEVLGYGTQPLTAYFGLKTKY